MTFSRKHSSLSLTTVCLFLLPVMAVTQETGKTSQSSLPPSMALLNVRVTDEAGHPVSDIGQEDFHVTEDGVPQTISFFSKEDVSLSYGLVIDNSGSLHSQFGKLIEAAKIIINSNKPDDETFLIRFISSDKIEKVQDFTSNQSLLVSGLDNLYIEGGETAVIDAVYVSVDYASKYKKKNSSYRRPILILITDGEDRASQYKRAELADLLHKEDIQIFVIGLVKEAKSRKKAVDLLNFLAQETGGRAFFPESTSELRSIAEEIVRDMRTQYLIGYKPSSGVQSGGFHKVQVTIAETPNKERRIAVTRSGYIAEPNLLKTKQP